MYFEADVYKELSPYLLRIPTASRKEVENRIRLEIMERTKSEALKIYASAIERVYVINWQCYDSVDLPQFLATLKVEDVGIWRFKVFVNEEALVFKTKMGDPVYEIGGFGVQVHQLDQYWKTPISGIHEEKYIWQEAFNGWENYIASNFKNMVSDIIARNLR